LIDAGWVKEVEARDGAPVWRKDMASGETYALKMTAKGLKAATAMIEGADGKRVPSATPAEKKTGAPAQRAASVVGEPMPPPNDTRGEIASTSVRAPRANSKLGRVLDVLAADAGATIGELTSSDCRSSTARRCARNGDGYFARSRHASAAICSCAPWRIACRNSKSAAYRNGRGRISRDRRPIPPKQAAR